MTERLLDLTIGPVGGLPSPLDALRAAAEDAPYLARLLNRHAGAAEAMTDNNLSDLFSAQLHAISSLPSDTPLDDVSRVLRTSKEVSHMIAAAGDLSGHWDVSRVTQSLTDLADVSVRAALEVAFAEAVRRGDVAPTPVEDSGLFLIAMGKMGARELNYSSDIDLIAVFDPDRFKTAARSQKDAAAKIIRDVVQLLEARTEHGYVFRTDLRLRPDPGSTQIAVSASAALDYYETIGQNWERMAYIKARVCAGDAKAGAAYLEALEPYVWRHHLDYWAIADIHAIKRQIHAQGRHAELDAKDFDVKLGRGGIREIEFFVQTQQLILGGRNSDLRSRETLSALRALEEIDAVDTDLAEDLDRAYAYLRGVEHRIQMVNDEQTHRLPDTPERRAQIARLCGVRPAVFEADLAKVRRRVHSAYSDLFAQEERLSGEGGNLVFTGVDDDPDTLATLAEMGFSSPETVTKAVRNWHRGGVAGTRSARGRQLLTVLTPRLLQMMADAGEPDAAFTRFGDFLSGVRGGVQALSLMLAEPALTADLIATMSFAPKLARDLASRPALLDAMLDARFQHPVQNDPPGEREKALRALAERCEYFEDVLNAARRFHREEAFRIGYQLLRGKAHAVEAGAAYADLADACIAVLADAAKAEVENRFGAWTAKWAVCGLGKLGGREMTASSDLDIMVIYEPQEGQEDLAARFTQRLISALSAPTEEGALYEVDMQLRPSGRAGPVAVKISAFETYYQDKAWTWEFMALTRLRPIAGDPDLCARIQELTCKAVGECSSKPGLTDDVSDMRRRIARERKPSSRWDLKLAEGGVVDAEFVVQHAMLLAAAETPGVVKANTLAAIDALSAAGQVSGAEASALRDGLSLQLNLQQALRIAASDQYDPSAASEGLKTWLAGVVDIADFASLEAELFARQDAIAEVRLKKLGPLATETPASSVEPSG